MPDTYGKRERKKTQERKAAAREERRAARKRRREEGPAEAEEILPLDGPSPSAEGSGTEDTGSQGDT